MVILGGWVFLMSEVPLYARGADTSLPIEWVPKARYCPWLEVCTFIAKRTNHQEHILSNTYTYSGVAARVTQSLECHVCCVI